MRTTRSPLLPSQKDSGSAGRLLVASHTLPLEDIGNRWQWRRPLEDSQALAPAPLRLEGGLWIGWTGPPSNGGSDGLATAFFHPGDTSGQGVTMSLSPLEDYDPEPAMQTLWPLFHGLPEAYRFDARFWPAFERLNGRMADLMESLHQDGDRICITDPRLVQVGERLRRRLPEIDLGLSLRTPFPPPELFFLLPHADRWLGSLLSYDVVTFRCSADRDRALACLNRLFPDAATGRANQTRGLAETLWFSVQGPQGPRKVFLQVSPPQLAGSGLDAKKLPEWRKEARQLRERFEGRQVIFAADRLDPVQGIPHKIRAFGRLLDQRPELADQVVLVQRVEPWYPDLPQQVDLRSEIEGTVGEVNGRHGYAGTTPVQYHYGPTFLAKRLAYHAAADVSLVTPIRDAYCRASIREFQLSRFDAARVLVLSELTDDADHLGEEALKVNPLDVAGFAAGLEEALSLASASRDARLEPVGDVRVGSPGAGPSGFEAAAGEG